MIKAAMIWNEPNNKSHWDLELDPDFSQFAELAKLAGQAIHAENPEVTRVLGGMSPIDPLFVRNMNWREVTKNVDAVAVHGFPLDWNHWKIDEWPDKLAEIKAETDLPVWVSEVGVSTFGADEVQDFGLMRTAELILDKAPHVQWYSLYDLPKAWPATTRHREAEGSSYYRHFYMGLLDEHGSPKIAAKRFHEYTPQMGICQWVHYEDHRLDDMVKRLREFGVKDLRTGLSWADWCRPDAERWFDHKMAALDEFDLTVTFCFTPEHRGLMPHHTSPPQVPEEFAEFCATMIRRYAPGQQAHAPARVGAAAE